jgi:tetratricopeptide (TPR) repeat protein
MVGFFIRGTFDAPAWVMLPLRLGEQLALALMIGGAVSGVAYWAHIGGFVFGLGAALAIRQGRVIERYIQPRLGAKVETAVIERPGLDLALVARSEGRHEDAYELLAQELQNDPRDADVAALYWETADELQRHTNAVPLLLCSIQAQLRSGETETVCTLWERLIEADPTVQVEASFLLRLTQLQARMGNRDQARQTLRRALMSAGPSPAPGLALKIARMGQRLDPAIARATLRALIQRGDLPLEDQSAAQCLLAEISSATVQVAEAAEPVAASSSQPQETAEPIPLALD